VVANMIGTGVFTTSGFLLGDLKSPWIVLLAWAVGGLIALLGAVSYGALARAIPESGGEYLYLSRTVHPAAGFVAGWVSLLAGFSAPLAAVAFGFGEYCKDWLPQISVRMTGTFLLVVFSIAHATNVRRGAAIQNVAVAIKLIALTALVTVGLAHLPDIAIPLSNPAEESHSFSIGAFAVSLVWISFSYAGWNAATYVAGEVVDPEKNLPRSLLLATLTVTIAYLGVNAVFVFSGPASELAGKLDVGRIAAGLLGGPAWQEATTALVTLALATSASAMIMAGPRVYARMASDGHLPKWLAHEDGPPRHAIALQLALSLAFLWTNSYEALLTYIGFTLGLSNTATVIGLLLLNRKEPASVKIPGGVGIPILFLAFAVFAIGFTIWRKPAECGVGFLTIAIGFIGWRLSRK